MTIEISYSKNLGKPSQQLDYLTIPQKLGHFSKKDEFDIFNKKDIVLNRLLLNSFNLKARKNIQETSGMRPVKTGVDLAAQLGHLGTDIHHI